MNKFNNSNLIDGETYKVKNLNGFFYCLKYIKKLNAFETTLPWWPEEIGRCELQLKDFPKVLVYLN